MSKRIVLLTGSELRHDFVRKALAISPGIEMVAAYCEGAERSLANAIDKNAHGGVRMATHVEARTRSEEDFFAPFVALTPDHSNMVSLPKGEINDRAHIEAIIALKPDLLVAYGSSIIKGMLLESFAGKFLNVHLGLSPYYRGSGTNIWALINDEPECFGATFMHMSAGIDAGEIIHQIRARIFPGDTPHQIGNRLIADMVPVYAAIIRDLATLPQPQGGAALIAEKVYKFNEFTPEAVNRLYDQFESGMVQRYLDNYQARTAARPIAIIPSLDTINWEINS